MSDSSPVINAKDRKTGLEKNHLLLSVPLPSVGAERANIARPHPFLDAVPMKRVIASSLALEIRKYEFRRTWGLIVLRVRKALNALFSQRRPGVRNKGTCKWRTRPAPFPRTREQRHSIS
jgi:hypothetical protein